MLNVKANEMNGEEVLMSMRRRDIKEDRWMELTMFIVNEVVEWDQLFKITNTTGYEDLEQQFLNARWCDYENAMVFELKNGNKFMALKL